MRWVSPWARTAGPFLSVMLYLWAAALAAGPVVLVLGDSLSAGHGLDQGQGWVSLLQRRLAAEGLPHRVVNASVSGLTTAEGRARLPGLLARHHPTVLVLALGGNDGLRGLPLRAMKAHLRAMVEEAQAAGARVLLAGVRLPPNYGPLYTRAFQQVFRQVAEETGAVLLPSLLAGVEEDRGLFQADGLHPTAAAQPRILDNVWPLLRPLLVEAPQPGPKGSASPARTPGTQVRPTAQ